MSGEANLQISLKRPKGYFKSSTLTIPNNRKHLDRFNRRSKTSSEIKLIKILKGQKTDSGVSETIPEQEVGTSSDISSSPPHSIVLKIGESASGFEVGLLTEEMPVEGKFGFSRSGEDSSESEAGRVETEIYSADRESVTKSQSEERNVQESLLYSNISNFGKLNQVQSLKSPFELKFNDLKIDSSLMSGERAVYLKMSRRLTGKIGKRAIARAYELGLSKDASKMILDLVHNDLKKKVNIQKIELGIQRRVTTMDWNPKKEESWNRFNEKTKILKGVLSGSDLGLQKSRFGQGTPKASGLRRESKRQDSGIIRWDVGEESGGKIKRKRRDSNLGSILETKIVRPRRSQIGRRKISQKRKSSKRPYQRDLNSSNFKKGQMSEIRGLKHKGTSQTNQKNVFQTRGDYRKVMEWTQNKLDVIVRIDGKERQLASLKNTTGHMVSKVRDREVRAEFQEDLDFLIENDLKQSRIKRVPKLDAHSTLLKRLEKGNRQSHHSQNDEEEPETLRNHHISHRRVRAQNPNVSVQRESQVFEIYNENFVQYKARGGGRPMNNSSQLSHYVGHSNQLSNVVASDRLNKARRKQNSSMRNRGKQMANVSRMLVRLNEEKFQKKKNIFKREQRKLLLEEKMLDKKMAEVNELRKDIQDFRKKEIQSNIFKIRRDAIEKKKQIQEGNCIIKQLLFESNVYQNQPKSKFKFQ